MALQPGQLDLHGVTILVIEDHEDSREGLRVFVESLGAHVSVAENGEAALEAAARETPHLVLCDLRMPRMDGFEFLRRLRYQDGLSHVRVIAISASANDQDIRRTWSAGFNGYLPKPIDFTVLQTELERIFWAHRVRPEAPAPLDPGASRTHGLLHPSTGS